MHDVLATNSDLIFVWHDNAGQSFPDNNDLLQTKVDTHGFTVDIRANAILPEPIILLCSAGNVNTVKNVVNIGKNSSVQIIEYIMSDDTGANNSINTIINCSPGAQLKHCILLQAKDATEITQQAITKINQEADSNVSTNIFSFGGVLSKIELTIALQGQNATCQAASLAYTNSNEVQDVLLTIDHLVPHCTSNCVARGVLKDQSSSSFVGHVIVQPNAQKSFADLQIKNLLCSPKAQAFNRPELEIYNDDVHCSHGSSTGQMNEEALFYMRTRGLDEPTAISMLIKGFIKPTIESCTIPAIADFVRGIIGERA